MSIDKSLNWIIPHIILESERKLLDFPIGQRVRKCSGGWKWKGAIATVVGHKRQPLGHWEIEVKFDDPDLEIYNQRPWGAWNLSMTEFEPVSFQETD